MKKSLITLLLICSFNFAYAEYNADEIILDVEPIQSATQIRRQNLQSKSYNYTTTNKQQTNILYDESGKQSQKSIKLKKEKQYKNLTIGAESNTAFSEEKASQNRSIYSNYKFDDRFSVNSKYDTKTTGQVNDKINGSFSIAPEMRINQKMSVSTVLSRNLGDKSNSEEVKLNIEPFKDDRVNLNVGAGQIQYDDGSATHSRIDFGTQFKF